MYSHGAVAGQKVISLLGKLGGADRQYNILNGVTDISAELQYWLTELTVSKDGVTSGILVLEPGVFRIGTDVTIPANVTVDMNGGEFSIDTGKTITVNGTLDLTHGKVSGAGALTFASGSSAQLPETRQCFDVSSALSVSGLVDVTVGMFGAVGDGTTDDAAAIQAAVDSLSNGGTIKFGAKTYVVETTITVPSNITFLGEGIQKTVIKASGGIWAFTQVGTGISQTTSVMYNIWWDLSISGQGMPSSNGGLNTTYAKYIHMLNVEFVGLEEGAIAAYSLNDSAFVNCMFVTCGTNTSKYVVYLHQASGGESTSQTWFTGCRFEGCLDRAIYMDNAMQTIVTDCKFHGAAPTQSPHITCSANSAGNLIQGGCYFSLCGDYNIELFGERCIVSDSIFTGDATYTTGMIHISGASAIDNIITNNHFGTIQGNSYIVVDDTVIKKQHIHNNMYSSPGKYRVSYGSNGYEDGTGPSGQTRALNTGVVALSVGNETRLGGAHTSDQISVYTAVRLWPLDSYAATIKPQPFQIDYDAANREIVIAHGTVRTGQEAYFFYEFVNDRPRLTWPAAPLEIAWPSSSIVEVPVNTEYFMVFNDFNTTADYDAINFWQVGSEQNQGTIDIATNTRHGILTLANSGAFLDGTSVQLSRSAAAPKQVIIESGKQIYFEARVKVDVVDQFGAVVGLCATDTTLMTTAGVGQQTVPTATDYIGIFKNDDGTASWTFRAAKSSSQTSQGTVVAANADWQRLGFLINGTSYAQCYIDGVAQKSHIATNLPDGVTLSVSFGVLNGDANSRTMQVDYFLLAQSR